MNRSITSVRKTAAWMCTAALALALCCLPFQLVQEQRSSVRIETERKEAVTVLPVEQQVFGTVQVNFATVEELQVLYGIGPAYAQAIVDEREANGPFFYPEDLITVKGIGTKRLDGFRDMLDMTVPVAADQ